MKAFLPESIYGDGVELRDAKEFTPRGRDVAQNEWWGKKRCKDSNNRLNGIRLLKSFVYC